MKQQKLTTNFFGYKVEVIIDLPPMCNKTYTSVPFSISDAFSEKIECEMRSDTFSALPDDELGAGGDGCELSGSWRVIEIDYGIICRVLNWKYNFAQCERLTEELFIRYFGGVMGRHYYAKWNAEYQHDLHKMLSYFGDSPKDGQLFCDMIAEQMNKYEKRIENDKK